MSDEDFKKELEEKAKNPELEKVETSATKAEMILKLKCEECGEVQGFPTHCDAQMTFMEDDNQLKCEECGETQPMVEHCGKPMMPFIAKA